MGEEELEPLQPGEGQLPLRPHGVLLWVGGWPDPRQLVPGLGQLGAHDGVEVGLGDLLGVGDAVSVTQPNSLTTSSQMSCQNHMIYRFL